MAKNWAKDEEHWNRAERNRDKTRHEAEEQYRLLSSPQTGEFPKVPYHKKKKVPGGNQKLPVTCELLGPSPSFWEEDMPSYVLGILDETVTNGYFLSGAELRLLCDGTELGKLRARYAKAALLRQGAIEVI